MINNNTYTGEDIVKGLTQLRTNLKKNPSLINASRTLTKVSDYQFVATNDEDVNRALDHIHDRIYNFPIDSKSELDDEAPDPEVDDQETVDDYYRIKNEPYQWYYEGFAGAVTSADVAKIITGTIEDLKDVEKDGITND